MDTTSLYGSCGAIGVAVTIIPTALLVISEVLGVSSGKSNGIVHLAFCLIEKIKNRESITEDEILTCLKKTKKVTDVITEAASDIENPETKE